jgi:hypothetical protein
MRVDAGQIIALFLIQSKVRMKLRFFLTLDNNVKLLLLNINQNDLLIDLFLIILKKLDWQKK